MTNKIVHGWLLLITLSACVSASKNDAITKADQDQQAHLRQVEDLVEDQQCDQALRDITAFRRTYPETPYFQTSRMFEAKCYHEQGQYREAIDLYEKIQNATMDNNPQLWAEARYESSFSYEALGDSENALSVLFGLEKSKAPIGDDIALAELPARIASLYFEQGRDRESAQYLDKAEHGLRILMKEKGVDSNRRRFSETLYHMGKVASPQLSTDNFPRVLQAHRRAQIYLLRSMELNVPGWSQRAADDLIKSYRNYWSFIQTQWSGPEDSQRRTEALKNIHTMLSESMYRQPTEPEMWNDSLKSYFSFASHLEREVSSHLFSVGETTMLVEKNPNIKTPRKKPKKLGPQQDIVSPDPNL